MDIQIIIINFVVGLLIGLTGVGGFILPVYYLAVLNMDIKESFALSFSAFLVSGVIGSISYIRMKLIDFNDALYIAIGALVGGTAGVSLSLIVPDQIAKGLLYVIVLFAGISILLKSNKKKPKSFLLYNKVFMVLLGVSVGVICSLAGAGGALILVPVLSYLGYDVKKAVGLGILASIFVSLPSMVGYFAQSVNLKFGINTVIILLSHGLAVILGASLSSRINQRHIKLIVSYISIISALFLIVTEFIL